MAGAPVCQALHIRRSSHDMSNLVHANFMTKLNTRSMLFFFKMFYLLNLRLKFISPEVSDDDL